MHWTAKQNRYIREEILDAVGQGHRTVPAVVDYLGAPEMTVRFYVKLLQEQRYLLSQKKTLILNEEFSWCEGCDLIPDCRHPEEWCE